MYLNGVLVFIIVALVIVQFFERRDLYNRIMSRDINEYKQRSPTKQEKHISAHERTLKKWRDTNA